MTIGAMIKRIAGLAGTKDVSDWEDEFITSIVHRSHNGDDTTKLSERQIAVVERIFNKHFSG
jgi:hypothetical protein